MPCKIVQQTVFIIRLPAEGGLQLDGSPAHHLYPSKARLWVPAYKIAALWTWLE